MDTVDKIALYSGLNVLLTRRYHDEDKKLGEPMMIGIPIYALGEVIYDTYYRSKNIMAGQEYIFPLLWQSTFNSLIYKNNGPILLDAIIVLSTQFISKQFRNI